MAKFTENGFEIDGVSAIREKLNNKAKEVFAPLLNGEELSVDDSGVLGRIFGIVAEPIALQEEAIQNFINNIDPNQASDTLLDDFLYLSGMSRLSSSPATVDLMLFGNIGVSVLSSASARSSITGDVFNFTDDVTFSTTNTNGIEFKINDTSPQTYTITYSIDGNFSVNPTIYTSSVVGDTEKDIAQRIMQTINNQSSDLLATITKQNNVNIIIKNRDLVGDFSVSPNLTVESSYMPVSAISATYSAIIQEPNTITNIASGAKSGWISVTNPFYSVESKPIEKDADARYRWRLYKAEDGYGEYDILRNALIQTKGVRFINIQQNITSNTNGTRTNQGVVIVVEGGNPNDIAQTIFDNIAVGTATDGDLTYQAFDSGLNSHDIKFSRPQHTPIFISMSLKALPNFPTNGKNIIKQRIVDWFNNLEVGEDILYSRLFDPINQTQGFSVNNLKIGRVGGLIGTNDIVIKYNEIATIKPDDIIIGGS